MMLVFALSASISFSSCSGDDDDYVEDTDSSTDYDPVYTGDCSNITYNSASISASFYLHYWDYLGDESLKVSKIGIILSKKKGWFNIESADKVKTFSFNKLDKSLFHKEGVFTDLESDCVYYAKAFVIYAGDMGEDYGDVISFRTLENPAYPHHEYVDLGTSVKWATCNIGASAPEQSGDFYSFAESETKIDYSINNYSHHFTTPYTDEYGNKGIKYNFYTSTFDICKYLWGNNWRLPTQKEIKELCEKCQWKWTSLNGIYGYEVKGQNGNSIFLPASGYYDGQKLEQAGIKGCYMATDSDKGLSGWSSSLCFYKESHSTDSNPCWKGYTVRAVKE